MRFAVEFFSFLVGFATATLFWWLIRRMRPLWGEFREGRRTKREAAKVQRSTGVEESFRRLTLRRAQGMHLAAPLFALDEIISIPKLIAPPQPVSPDPSAQYATIDIVGNTIPYMPSWPEFASYYNGQTMDLAQVVETGINFVITGQPGIGKTVALAYLATLAANRDPQLGQLKNVVPFIYHTADLRLPATNSKEVLEPIIEAASEHASLRDRVRLPRFIERTFQSGRALLLLDGYDELPQDARAEIREYLQAVLEAYPDIHVVATGSPDHLEGFIELGFIFLSLMPWTSKARDEFLGNWGQLWTQTIAIEAWSNDRSNAEHIDPLLINSWLVVGNQTLTPLEMTLKAWAGYAGDSLGPGVLDALATHIRRLSPGRIPLAALETLGMQVVLASQPIFDSRSARGWVKQFDVESDIENENALDDQDADGEQEKDTVAWSKRNSKRVPATSSGLLNKITASGLLESHIDNRMRFLHPVFAGYLAGRALAYFNANESLLQQPDWSGRNLAMRYTAAFGDASDLANAMLERTAMPLHQHLFTAARWLRDTPRTAPWRGKVFTQLATLLQAEDIPLTLRAQAACAFYWSGDPSAAPLFRKFLNTPSQDLIQLVALGSGAIRDQKAVDTLSNALQLPSGPAQRAVALALVAIGTTPAMEAVARALLGGAEDLRRAAAEALANDKNEGQSMLKEGMGHKDILVRHAIVYGLARVEDDWAMQALQNIQIEDDQWVVRNSATEVLDSKKDISARLPQPLTTPSDTPWLVEFASKLGMGISPGSPATDVLTAALKSEVIEESLGALPYLKHMPSEGVITSLYHAMYRNEPELRDAVFLVLCELAANGVELPDPMQFGYG